MLAACGQNAPVIDSGVRTDYSSATLAPGDDLFVVQFDAMEKGIAPGETASLRLDASGTQPVPYVIVGPTEESTSSFEIGFANPAAGSCPNATVDGWKVPLCKVGDTAKWTHRADGAGSAVFDVRRLDNADGRTRYDVQVNWT